MKKSKASGSLGLVGAVGIGLGVNLVTLALLTVLVGNLVAKERIGEGSMGLAAAVILVLTSSIGCIVAAQRLGKQKMTATLITATVYLGVLLTLGAALFGSHLEGLPLTGICVLIPGAVTGFLTTGRKKSGAKSYKKLKFS